MAAGEGRSEADLEPRSGTTAAMAAPARRSGPGTALALMLGVVGLWAAVLVLILRAAALGPDDAGKVFVVFPPGMAPGAAFAAIVTAGGEPVRPVLGHWAWIAHADGAGFVGQLERNGALAAFGGAPVGLSLAGCFAWATDRPLPHDPLARALEARAVAEGL